MKVKNQVKFIDLFAGIGGLRLGFEQAFNRNGFDAKCVMTSEIKPFALNVLKHNYPHEFTVGDITKVKLEAIPDFDFLLGGFPCQPFSAAGNRHGFLDTRGTLFFEIEKIIEAKRPYGFVLENVEGIVKHDLLDKRDKMGRTLSTILEKLTKLGYKVNWNVLNAAEFGLPQARKRVFIVGTRAEKVSLEKFDIKRSVIKDILEEGLPTLETKFTKALLKHYTIETLYGKSIKDKRGGSDNIHSWDIGIKGVVSREQKIILNKLFKERRKKHWAEKIGIDWMDGMALTLNQIKTFHKSKTLKSDLDDLVEKGYLAFEHPKSIELEKTEFGIKRYRAENKKLPKGYNIVSGKLSFEINKILDPNDIAPTLVATDMARIAVPDGKGLRKLTMLEGLRLFGYPEWFELPVKSEEAFDLLGNTVAVNVVDAVCERLALSYQKKGGNKKGDYIKSEPVTSR